jgi:hypothetical protein
MEPSVHFSPFERSLRASRGAQTSRRNQVLARWRPEARNASL